MQRHINVCFGKVVRIAELTRRVGEALNYLGEIVFAVTTTSLFFRCNLRSPTTSRVPVLHTFW